jgi:uncharacterized protein (DUF1810 family)
MPATDDPFDLKRFLQAQEDTYAGALAEIRRGRKQSHWMWFVFPQFEGLGSSTTSRYYAIRSLDEARAYLGHPVLGPRLLACASALVALDARSALDVLGSPDDMKLRSCATLFAAVAPAGSVFEQILDKYFAGARDQNTLRLIASG